ncbi:MAG: hypothetical protein VXZ18_01495 [Pseudomonadota bacterium]|nr:hypothetical protein [Pseudomonadota bacterium]
MQGVSVPSYKSSEKSNKFESMGILTRWRSIRAFQKGVQLVNVGKFAASCEQYDLVTEPAEYVAKACLQKAVSMHKGNRKSEAVLFYRAFLSEHCGKISKDADRIFLKAFAEFYLGVLLDDGMLSPQPKNMDDLIRLHAKADYVTRCEFPVGGYGRKGAGS